MSWISRNSFANHMGPDGPLDMESETSVGLSIDAKSSLIAELKTTTEKFFELTVGTVRFRSKAVSALEEGASFPILAGMRFNRTDVVLKCGSKLTH